MVVSSQIGAALGAVAALAMAPPSKGRMLVIPLPPGGNAVAGSLATGALLLAPGPIAGSAVVIGDRAALARRFPFPAAIIVAAPPALCGRDTDEAIS